VAETEAALRSLEESRGRDGEGAEALKAQLKEALSERTDLIQQVESLNQQVGEKTQRTIELLKERDRLLNETLDLEPYRARAQELEAALKARDEELTASQEALETFRTAQEQLNATIEGLVAQQASLEGLHQSALLEVAGYKEKAHAFQMEAAGFEATMRGQGRDLAELGARVRQVEGELEASQAQVLDREQQLVARQEAIQEHQGEIARLAAQLAALRQEWDEANIQHEGEKLELMNGLDMKETEILRLNQALARLQEAHAALEREKQGVHGQLSEHRDRLQNLDGLLQEIQEKLRRGSDLARG
jgi:chromosome segregation ATPase